MVEKLNAKRVANALAIVFGIVSLVCLLITLIPGGTWFLGLISHGIDLAKIEVTPSIGLGIVGVIEAIVLGWIIGWLFAKIYNSLK